MILRMVPEMTLDEELRLSYYQPIAELDQKHGVQLVQHLETHQVFVKKVLSGCDFEVIRCLQRNPVPGMPRIREAVEDARTLTVIEDYVSGETLEQRLDRLGPMGEREALELLLRLTEIVGRLHAFRPPIIHRDIKASNIILTPEGDVKLLDLDAAKRYHEAAVRDTRLIGTVGYAAPEQYGFGASGVQTDIYALGVLLNVLVTGDLPTERAAPGKVGKLIARCTQIDPARRYRSTDEVRQDLEKLLRGGTRSSESAPLSASWLPPGFREKRVRKMLPAALWYAALFWFSFSLKATSGPGSSPWPDRILCLLGLLGGTLVAGNYRNSWHSLGLDRIPWKPVRYLLAALAVPLGFVLAAIAAAILDVMLG